MRVYELTIILNPNLDKEAVNAELDKLTGMVESANGTIFEVQHLGLRRLSFEMAGFTQGNYYTIYFNAVPEVLTQMDKSMKLNEAVLRSMTIVLKQSVYEASRKKKPEEERRSMDMPKRPTSAYSESEPEKEVAKEPPAETETETQPKAEEESESEESEQDGENTEEKKEEEA